MRRRQATKRPERPDTKFESLLVGRFISQLMKRGKKTTAEAIMYDALESFVEQVEGGGDPVELLEKALDRVRPSLEVKSRRVGGATYQVPVEVSSSRSRSLAMRWMIMYSNARRGVPMARALAQELTDAYNGTGSAIKKRDDTHKMAQANRAFAHYRW